MTIFHGEDQVASRKAFIAQKNSLSAQASSSTILAGDTLTLPDLIQATSNQSLFGSNLVVIEGLFSRRPSNEKKQLITHLLGSLAAAKDILVWESKDVSVQLKDFPSQGISRFDLPKHIFRFLDDLSLSSFHNCLEVMPVEQIFASLVTRLHKVLQGTGSFNRKFTPSELKTMTSQLLAIDYAQKTSSPPYDLEAAIELFLLKIVR